MSEFHSIDAFRAIDPQVRHLLGHAGVEVDEPDHVVRDMLILTAIAIVQLARENGGDISEASRVASIAAFELRRLVAQVGLRGSVGP